MKVLVLIAIEFAYGLWRGINGLPLEPEPNETLQSKAD